jgi:uncharacterized membrane protein
MKLPSVLGPIRRGLPVQISIAALIVMSTWTPAFADFRVCNESEVDVDISRGYHHVDFKWTSQGWLSSPIGQCVTLVRGDLRQTTHRYYIYATGANGRHWSAHSGQKGGWFCIRREQKFALHNRDYSDDGKNIDCERAGLTAKQFVVIDFENSSNYTLYLKAMRATENKPSPRPAPESSPSPSPSLGAGTACQRFPNLC